MNNRVVLIGRPNVGKSSLFNRIIGQRRSVVEDVPGITRDSVEAKGEWKGKEFLLVDTGGMVPDTEDEIFSKIRETVKREVDRADVILFVVSAKEGLTPLDSAIARLLYPYRDKVLVVANKADSRREEDAALEFFNLGFEKLFPVSAVHGRGVGELLDEVVSRLREDKVELSYEGVHLTFVGRPNVGKSSLINALLKEERVIVSPVAGTTRDTLEIPFSWEGNDFVLVDTPGVRRPARVEFGVEFFSVNRTLRAVERSDVVCLVIDLSEGVTRQDKRLAGLIERRYRGCVVVANKADLSPLSEDGALNLIRKELFFLDFAPVVLTVATEGKGVEDILRSTLLVYRDYTRQHKTSFVNRAVQRVLREKPPPRYRGREVKVYYAFQEGIKPPTLVVITNHPEGWKESYVRFFVRRLRSLLRIEHSPLRLVLRERG